MGRELCWKSIFGPAIISEFRIFNDRLIFWAFYGLSSQNHSSDELRADLISLFPVSIPLLVQILSVLSHFFRRRSEKKSFRAPPSLVPLCFPDIGLFSVYHFLLIEVRGDPHGVFRPREGGLTRIRCFRVLLSLSSLSSSGPKNQKICKFLHAPRTEDQKSQKSAKIDKNQKCPEWSKMTQNKVRRPPKLILDLFPKNSRKFSKNRRKIFFPKLFFPHVGPYSKASRPIFRPNWAKQKKTKFSDLFAYLS